MVRAVLRSTAAKATTRRRLRVRRDAAGACAGSLPTSWPYYPGGGYDHAMAEADGFAQELADEHLLLQTAPQIITGKGRATRQAKQPVHPSSPICNAGTCTEHRDRARVSTVLVALLRAGTAQGYGYQGELRE